jgi:triosephosphate isomerase
MNKTADEADDFLDPFLPSQSTDGPEVIICPTFLALGRVAERCAGTSVRVAAQNMHFDDSGAYTGEVSAPMLLDIGVDGVILVSPSGWSPGPKSSGDRWCRQ